MSLKMGEQTTQKYKTSETQNSTIFTDEQRDRSMERQNYA